MANSVVEIERALAANRQDQAKCAANVQRFTAAANAVAENEDEFGRRCVKADAEERRLAVFKARESALLDGLPLAKKREELEHFPSRRSRREDSRGGASQIQGVCW